MDSRVVYSTGSGKICQKCGHPVSECVCHKRRNIVEPAPVDGNIRISYETKGRKGKGVTLISGLPIDRDAIEELAKSLKQRFACGGTVQGRLIELQGDHREQIAQELTKRGFSIKQQF